jgi:hypothetical protein
VIVNGHALKNVPSADSYVEVTRIWKRDDVITLTLPKTLRTEPLPDNPQRFAVMWGPLVLAGDLGPEVVPSKKAEEENLVARNAPVMVADAMPVEKWLKPIAEKPGEFRSASVGPASDVRFVPFYQLPRRRYAIYWDWYTPAEWAKKSAEFTAEDERRKKLDAATVAFAQPGQMQAERDANEQGEETSPIQLEGRYGRRGKKWFSFDLPVDAVHPSIVLVTYSNDARRDTSFDVLAEGEKIGERRTERKSPEKPVRFFDVEYAVPPALVAGKQKITLRFEAHGENEIPGVFGVRLIRADVAR